MFGIAMTPARLSTFVSKKKAQASQLIFPEWALPRCRAPFFD
jgi:hypothetical protein